MPITSRSNEAVKAARALLSRKGRLASGLHLIEGEKLVREAVISGRAIQAAFLEEGHAPFEELLIGSGAKVYAVSRSVLESITDTKTPQWVCAAVETPSMTLPANWPKGMIVALDTVQDPGNLGAILRSADAMGAAGLLLSPGCADPWSPKCMRSAMGSAYHIPVWQTDDLKGTLQGLANDGAVCICGHLQGQEALPHPSDRCVIVIGNEGNGVGEDIAALCARVRLPMYGQAESLNASVAAGILMYEVAKRMHENTKTYLKQDI